MSTRPGPFGCVREAAEPEGHGALVLLQDVDPLQEDDEGDEAGDEKSGSDHGRSPFWATESLDLENETLLSDDSHGGAGGDRRSADASQYSPCARTRPLGASSVSARPVSPISPSEPRPDRPPAHRRRRASRARRGRRRPRRAPGQDEREPHPVARLGLPGEEQERARDEAGRAGEREHAVHGDLTSATMKRIAEEDQSDAREVDRQHGEGVEREEQRDPPHDAGQHRARVRQLEVEADEAEQKEDVGHVRVRDDSEDALDRRPSRGVRAREPSRGARPGLRPFARPEVPSSCSHEVRGIARDDLDQLLLLRLALGEGHAVGHRLRRVGGVPAVRPRTASG